MGGALPTLMEPDNIEELRELARVKAKTSKHLQHIILTKSHGWLVSPYQPLETDQVLETIEP